MRRVRWGLLAAWGVLMVSLVWDPLTPALTQADNLASPFRLSHSVVTVQGVELPSEPYHMSNRIFWTMVLPFVPIVLMIFGHEFWRRICPLSMVSQIPRMFGFERRIKRLNRSSGRVEKVLALLPTQSWMREHALLFQFAFLALGVMCRLLFYNSNRTALLLAFLFLITFAFLVGLFYGGKTWCNYFCPTAVIQGIYTGPGGLLDSKAHIQKSPLAQSVCRTPRQGTDQSICVGCTSNCPDVDLENSYWKSVDSDQKRFAYYGFFGLVFAFYTYYFVYSGGWSYYMTGAWTHEDNQLGKLLSPGFYFDGYAVPIPKLLAAPLYFAVCIALSYLLFLAIEAAYAAIAEARGLSISKTRRRHHMLTVSAFLSFNLFYVFAGRPNIFLMPPWAIKLIDMTIVFVSVTWMIRSLARDPDRYRRENLGTTLREQLVRMGFRFEDVLEGRKIEQLSADEIYVLARTLPNLTQTQKREAYRSIVSDAIETGQTRSADSLKTLSEVRSHLGLTDADHEAIVAALGVADPSILNSDMAQSAETKIRRDNYRQFLVDLIQRGLSAGIAPAQYLASPTAIDAFQPVKAMFNISDEEHARIVAGLTEDDSHFIDNAKAILAQIERVEIDRFSLSASEAAEPALLRHALVLKQKSLVRELFLWLASVRDDAAVLAIGRTLRALIGRKAAQAIDEGIGLLPEHLHSAFLSRATETAGRTYFDVIGGVRPLEDVLRDLADDPDPFTAGLAISALYGVHASRPELWDTLANLPPLVADLKHHAERGTVSARLQIISELVKVDVFSQLELSALARIADAASIKTFRQGDLICRHGDAPDDMFVLVEGETVAFVNGADGRLVLGGARKGAVFGELGVITGRPRSASIEVASAEAIAISIPRDVIDDLLQRDLGATFGVLKVVSGYLQDTIASAGRAVARSMPAAAPAE